MTLFINLSTVHTLHPITYTVEQFVNLCNLYSKSYINSCHTFFKNLTRQAWVYYQYKTNETTLIQPYKLGKITTENFLRGLLNIFDFLKEDFTEEEAFALLTKAWNAGIALEQDRIYRFNTLTEFAKNEPVYLISNTNELNVIEILRLLKESHPDVEFFDNIDTGMIDSKEPIPIAPNIYLCLSYRYQLFKTSQGNHYAKPHSTMSMINYLANNLSIDKTSLCISSQYADDKKEATHLGIPFIEADDLFSATAKIKKQI